MIDPASLLEFGRSVSVVGIVLVEALFLYAGSGVLFALAGDDLKATIADE
ncbi:DUF7512 family protein [Halanaeroarchaeum sulfurireducens]|nr:hypothetical protein [Halanaeroarchaeum sulfurireducens]